MAQPGVLTIVGGSDALIGNLHVNAEGPVLQLVLDRLIKILAVNGWAEEVGLLGSRSQASRQRRKKGFNMLLWSEREPPAM